MWCPDSIGTRNDDLYSAPIPSGCKGGEGRVALQKNGVPERSGRDRGVRKAPRAAFDLAYGAVYNEEGAEVAEWQTRRT